MRSVTLKILSFIFTLVASSEFILAQAPNLFNYQAVVRNADGALVTNQAVNVLFDIFQGGENGVHIYGEGQIDTTNSFGLFTAQIGNGTVYHGSFGNIDWSAGTKYLRVSIDPTGGSNFTTLGTSQLISVPYALYAATSGNSVGGSGMQNFVPVFTGGTTLGNSAISDYGPQVSINAIAGPIQGATLTVEGRLGGGIDSATLALSNGSINGVDLWAYSVSTNPTAVFWNTGGGPFATFGKTGPTDLVSINSTGNGHGQVTFASDSGMDASVGSINASTAGLNTVFNGTTVTQTSAGGFGQSFAPYTDNVALLGTNSQRWAVVYATNGTIQTSDGRDKENIQPLLSGLNAVMQLEPVSYQWKNKNLQLGTGTNLGFIAQQVEKILPDVVVHAVNTDGEITAAKKEKGVDLEKDNYGVKYAEFIPVLVKAIQEQQKKIENLQKELNELKNAAKK